MRIFHIAAGLVLAASITGTAGAAAKTSDFFGEIVHSSIENVKVYNPKSHQTLSFIVTPKFDQYFPPTERRRIR